MSDLPRPQIVLIDGYALIYRAFFAMIARPLTTSRGENTSAAWGVANFLLRIQAEYQPEYIAWINDAGTSFRTETYPEYKATRTKLDDELQDTFDRSLDRVEELLRAFNVPLITVDGYEADDVIGTLAARAEAENLHAVIVSGDKDFYQLITPNCSLLNPGRGGAAAVEEEVVTMANASDRLGVPPEHVIDYLAMVGDSSDNVPGVRGIGDKTARKLIDEYGSLDEIIAHAGDLKAKRPREALTAETDNARLSRELVTIRTDVPVEVSFESLRATAPDPAALRAVFTELEFHSLIDAMDQNGDRAGGEAKAARQTTYDTVADVDGIEEVVRAARAAATVGIKALGTTADPRRGRLLGLALAVGGGRAWYLPFSAGAPALDLMGASNSVSLPELSDPALGDLVRLLEDASVTKTGHDVKQDGLLLRGAGVTLRGVGFDAMIASFLLDPGKRSHGLDVLAREHLREQATTLADIRGKGKARKEMADVSIEDAATHCCGAADIVLELQERLMPRLESTELARLLGDVELPLVSVLADMEWTGIRIDLDRLRDLARDFRQQLDELERAIYEEAGTDFNINSTPQLRHVLFEKLQLPILKKTKTGPSTDAEVLEQLADMDYAVPKLMLEYRELSKLMSTYVDALPRSVNPETGRVHTTFNQTGAATGRLSSSDPNLQNIPVRTERGGTIRTCFVPAESKQFVIADYSQIELRLLAHLSEDPAFIAAFERGGDIHRETAAIIFEVGVEDVTAEMRARAKTINFATIYGQGPFALSRQLGIALEEAKDFIAKYFERFAGVRAFMDGSIKRAREHGYVETIFGRRRYIPELKDKNFNIRSFGERTAMNSPIQGSAADLIKIAMVNLHRRLEEDGLLDEGAALLLQVHDELVLECGPKETDRVVRIVRKEMEGAATLRVPLVVDVGVGENWLDAKK